jgi:hypothetical protein
MRRPGVSSTVFAGALALAMPVYAADAGVLPGSRHAAFAGLSGITTPAGSGFEQSGEPAQGEARARSESDWLTVPPDPARHNLWVPSAEWATCLAVTIPLIGPTPTADRFVDAWTRAPVWDEDAFLMNYVLHPFMGAEAYLMVRNRDYGPIESFLFSTGVSFAWEYVFEAWVERPSTQDLLVTSPVGSLLGEIRFQMRRRLARWSPSVGRNTLLILVDPVEALHRYIGKEFLSRSNDPTDEAVGSSLNFGADHARLMVTLQF